MSYKIRIENGLFIAYHKILFIVLFFSTNIYAMDGFEANTKIQDNFSMQWYQMESSNTTGWTALIKAANDGDISRVKSLIIDYYYPIFNINEFNNLPQKQDFLTALENSDLRNRVQAELKEMICEGLIKDLARIAALGKKIEVYLVQKNKDMEQAKLFIFPAIHGDLDATINTAATIFQLYNEGDILLQEGYADKSDHSDITWLTNRAIRILADQKSKAIFGSYHPFESMMMTCSLAELFNNRKYLPETPFKIADGYFHFKFLPYKKMRISGWDIDLASELSSLNKKGQELGDETVKARNPFLIRTARKYLEQINGRVFLEAGADHFPEMAFKLRTLRRDIILNSDFSLEDIKGLLANLHLAKLPSSISEFFSEGLSQPKELLALRQTHDFLKGTPHFMFNGPSFEKAFAAEAKQGVLEFKNEIDECFKNPGIFRGLFLAVQSKNYEHVKSIFRALYYPLFFCGNRAFQKHIHAFAFLLYQNDLFQDWEKDIKQVVQDGVEADLAFIQRIGRDIENNTVTSLGLSSDDKLEDIFSHLTVTSSPGQEVKISFLPHDSKNPEEALANILFVKNFAGDRDAILLEEITDNGSSLDDISVESNLVLRILAAKKCKEAQIQCNNHELELLVKSLYSFMRSYVYKGHHLLTQNNLAHKLHLFGLPPHQTPFGSFGGPVSVETFVCQNDQLIALMQNAFDKGISNVWIFTSPERIASFSYLRFQLVNSLLAEEEIGSSKISGLPDSKWTLNDIFTKNNIDPFGIWLPILPDAFTKKLGKNNFRMYYQKTFLERNRQEIKDKLHQHLNVKSL